MLGASSGIQQQRMVSSAKRAGASDNSIHRVWIRRNLLSASLIVLCRRQVLDMTVAGIQVIVINIIADSQAPDYTLNLQL